MHDLGDERTIQRVAEWNEVDLWRIYFIDTRCHVVFDLEICCLRKSPEIIGRFVRQAPQRNQRFSDLVRCTIPDVSQPYRRGVFSPTQFIRSKQTTVGNHSDYFVITKVPTIVTTEQTVLDKTELTFLDTRHVFVTETCRTNGDHIATSTEVPVLLVDNAELSVFHEPIQSLNERMSVQPELQES
ncbi:hypothetical protein D9M70_393400 [compost metagenome]